MEQRISFENMPQLVYTLIQKVEALEFSLKENGVAGVAIPQSNKQEKSYVYGLDGLAKLLGCSRVTAQKIKNSGELKGCYMQVNRKLVFDVDLVKNALKGR